MTSPLRVLFICTENAARSQMAEALLTHSGGGSFVAASAGSRPARQIDPAAVEVLREHGLHWLGHRPKGFDAVAGESWDLVISLCEEGQESCPPFIGQPLYATWRMRDPSAEKDPAARQREFRDALQYLRQRIDLLRIVPHDKLAQVAASVRETPGAGI